MAWVAGRQGQDAAHLLVLPRHQLADPAAVQRWTQVARQAARLQHPHLASPVDLGVRDGWPFLVYELLDRATLTERLPGAGWPGPQAASCQLQLLDALAFAHEAGLPHHDVQPFLIVMDDQLRLQLVGLGAASEGPGLDPQLQHGAATDPVALRQRRQAAERDVLGVGVILHQMLTGVPALEEADVGRVIDRLPPGGPEVLRLPWAARHPLSEPLRAITNRATDRQPQRRYRSARSFLRALRGWLDSEAAGGGGPLAQLQESIAATGILPSTPGAADRVARLTLLEQRRTAALAEVVLEDFALSVDLLRTANVAQQRVVRLAASGAVLTARRALALLGLEGVRRCALALRDWPGPLSEPAAQALEEVMARTRRAGRVAVALRPAGYDPEVVYLVAVLQNLGRLGLAYHFPLEAAQVRRLMAPVPAGRDGEPDSPGMDETQACFAVMGAEPGQIGAALLRGWGLDGPTQTMLRRLPIATAVRPPQSDTEWLRTVASCAHEAVEALHLPAPKVLAALQRVVHRYGRVLGLRGRDLQEALRAPADTPIGDLGTPAPAAEPAGPPSLTGAAGVSGAPGAAGVASVAGTAGAARVPGTAGVAGVPGTAG